MEESRDTDTVEPEETEEQVREALQEQHVSLEPDLEETERLDREVPQEWTQLQEPELDPYRDEFTPEELQAFIDAPVDVPPEPELDRLTQEATQDLNIDALFTGELPRQQPEPERDLDFDR